MNRTTKALVFVTAGLFVCSPAVSVSLASTYEVEPGGGGDFVTIQDAIDAVSGSDVIELLDGTFEGEGNRDLDFLGKNITIRSQNGDPALCIIDCGGSQLEPHRGFYFHSGENTASVLEGITIRNGHVHNAYPEGGGGIYINGASPAITHCVITGNTATTDVPGQSIRGGGVAMTGSSAPMFIDCTISDNNVSGGQSYGAGIYCHVGPQATFNSCIISGNSGGVHGGGFYGYYSSAEFVACDFLDNSGINGGGALLGEPDADYRFLGCTFVGNSANNGGGVSCGHTATFENCTFALNSGAMYGGGILCHNTIVDIEIVNTIVAFSTTGAGIYLFERARSEPSVQCCDVFGNDGGEYGGALSDLTGSDGNISEDPRFCDMYSDDVSLCSNSPCLAGGNDCQTLIGSLSFGCDECESPVEETSWGRIKSLYGVGR